MHAADLASELGIDQVMVPDSCGVLSALGMVVGDERRDWVRTVYRPEDWDSESLSAAFARLEAEKSRETEGASLVRLADLRYSGQSHELTVVISGDMDRGRVARLFEQEHEKAFGYHAEGEPVELVNIRLTAFRKFKRPEIWSAPERLAEPVRRRVWFGGEWAEADVFSRSGLGSVEDAPAAWPGPVIIEDEEATTVIPPGWKASIDTAGNLWVKK
jgi:N-methylhydantoinase A